MCLVVVVVNKLLKVAITNNKSTHEQNLLNYICSNYPKSTEKSGYENSNGSDVMVVNYTTNNETPTKEMLRILYVLFISMRKLKKKHRHFYITIGEAICFITPIEINFLNNVSGNVEELA